jgi:hypothetical protein
MKYGHRFHWRLHCSQSRDGSPPFEGATVVRSLLQEAALNVPTGTNNKNQTTCSPTLAGQTQNQAEQ